MTRRIQVPFTVFSMAAYLPLLAWLAWGCEKSHLLVPPGTWRHRAGFEGVARQAATGFTIGNFAYMGTGSDGNQTRLKDFWSYDQARNAWIQCADFPGAARYGGVGFSVNDKGYLGLGVDEDGGWLKDFYEYDPASNHWQRIPDFGGTARQSAVAFSIGSRGYVGLGDDLNNTKDFWAYESSTGTWSRKAAYGGSKRVGAIAFVVNDLAYVGTGSDKGVNQIDWWAYDPVRDQWIERNKFTKNQRAFISRSYGVGFILNGKGYISQGKATGANATTWAYDPVTDAWTERAAFEGTNRQNAFGFSLNNKGYVTTGSSPYTTHDDLWEFDPNF